MCALGHRHTVPTNLEKKTTASRINVVPKEKYRRVDVQGID